jgi:Zn-finger nucleic acid-binding protein
MVATVSEAAVEIDMCAGCGGIWLDAGELEALTSEKVAPPPEGASPASVRTPVKGEEEIRYRECARCGDIMTRRNFGTISGVVVDECPRHGVFLDEGELQAIENFLRAGGLTLGEAARARQAQRQMPPPPEPAQELPRIGGRSRGGAAADVLWNLFFRW